MAAYLQRGDEPCELVIARRRRLQPGWTVEDGAGPAVRIGVVAAASATVRLGSLALLAVDLARNPF